MKILLTGGAGYIGSHALLALLSAHYDVVVFDSLENGHKEAIEHIETLTGKNIPFIKGDLKKKADIHAVFEKHADIEAVMHFGAYIEVGESVKNPLKYYENNVYGTLNLLMEMVEHKINKIVFSSTAAVYGMPKTDIIKETDETLPINPYGKSKLMVERMLEDLYISHGLRSIRLRYFNIAGASSTGLLGEAHLPESHLIPNVLFTALRKKDKQIIFGDDYNTPDGTCIRDYIHVEDLVDAHVLAMKKLETENLSESINLGSKNGYSVKEIIKACKEVTGIDFPVEVGERREGDPDKLIADSTKANIMLGWKQQRNLTDMIKSAWKWHTNNPNGFKADI